MKKLLLILVLLLLPAAALADVFVAGVDVSNGGYWTTDGSTTIRAVSASDDWHIMFDPAVQTLTLKNANICAPDQVPGVWADQDLRIVAADQTFNSILGGYQPQPASGSDENWEVSYGIYCEGDLHVSGKGALRVRALSGGGSQAISLNGNAGNGADLTVTDTALTAQSAQASGFSIGILTHGKMYVNNAVLTVRSGRSERYSYGVWAGMITAVSSQIDVQAGESVSWHSLGVYASLDLTDCTLTAAGNVSSPLSHAFSGRITQKGGFSEFTGGTSAFNSSADQIAFMDQLLISGAETPGGVLKSVTIAANGEVFTPESAAPVRRLCIAGRQPEPVNVPAVIGERAMPAIWVMLMSASVPAGMTLRKKAEIKRKQKATD